MGFEAGVGAYVKVMPYNSEGAGLSAGPGEDVDGDSSETVGVVAPVAAPGGPEDVELYPLEPTSLRVEWSPPTDTGGKGIVRYVVQRVSSTDLGNVATSSPVSAAGALLPAGARRRPRQRLQRRPPRVVVRALGLRGRLRRRRRRRRLGDRRVSRRVGRRGRVLVACGARRGARDAAQLPHRRPAHRGIESTILEVDVSGDAIRAAKLSTVRTASWATSGSLENAAASDGGGGVAEAPARARAPLPPVVKRDPFYRGPLQWPKAHAGRARGRHRRSLSRAYAPPCAPRPAVGPRL